MMEDDSATFLYKQIDNFFNFFLPTIPKFQHLKLFLFSLFYIIVDERLGLFFLFHGPNDNCQIDMRARKTTGGFVYHDHKITVL